MNNINLLIVKTNPRNNIILEMIKIPMTIGYAYQLKYPSNVGKFYK